MSEFGRRATAIFLWLVEVVFYFLLFFGNCGGEVSDSILLLTRGKGMIAGARILKDGGLLILACECHKGVISHSPLDKLLQSTFIPFLSPIHTGKKKKLLPFTLEAKHQPVLCLQKLYLTN